MYRRSRWIRSIGLVLVTVTAFAVSSCSSPTTAQPELVTAWSSEPKTALIGSAANEIGGIKPTQLLYAGLGYYDAKGTFHNEVADSISTTDGQTFDIKIKTGWTFTNGEPVTAKSFVDAWNYAASGPNAQANGYYLEPIKGYADVTYCEPGQGPPDKDGKPTCKPAPKTPTMSGLTVVSDTEFKVALSTPQADFPLRLGALAFMPLPSTAFADMKAFGDNPVGNGPYKIKEWKRGESIALEPNPAYQGPRAAKNAGVLFKVYTSSDPAYTDLLANTLDVLETVPSDSVDSFEKDLGDRAVNVPVAVSTTITIPFTMAHFGGDEGRLRRQAISMAINRPEITEKVFNHLRTPATDFTSPVIAGYSATIEGNKVLAFNADEAKKLWAQADQIAKWSGTFEIAYTTQGPNKDWVDAVANSIKNTLAINAAGKPFALFSDMRTQIEDGVLVAAAMSVWGADYPSQYNFLFPLYSSGAGENTEGYSNAAFDTLLDEGVSAPDLAAATAKFQQAQRILLADLPAVPLWYNNAAGGHSTKVSNVSFGWDGIPLYYAITKP